MLMTEANCSMNAHPGMRPFQKSCSNSEEERILSLSRWVCFVCAQRQSARSHQFQLLPLMVQQCHLCHSVRGGSDGGNPRNPITHMVCMNLVSRVTGIQGAISYRCGYVNQVSNDHCVSIGCGRRFVPGARTWFPRDTILLVPKDKSRDWFCRLCWALNPANTNRCQGPASDGQCTGMWEVCGVSAHETFYINGLQSFVTEG